MFFRICLITFFIIPSIKSTAQDSVFFDLPTYIHKKIDSLKSAGIDSILVFSLHSFGSMLPIYDSCGGSDDYFLIWNSGEKVYYQKMLIDMFHQIHCYAPVVPNPRSTVYTILRRDIAKIKYESLAPFVYRLEWEGEVSYRHFYTRHPTYYKLELYCKLPDVPRQLQYRHPMIKTVSDDQLLEKNYDGAVNLNYQYNHNSCTMLLLYRVMAELKELDLDKQLIIFPKTNE